MKFNGSRKGLKSVFMFVLLLALAVGSLGGCGSKKTYVDYFKDMLSKTEGTWKTSWVFREDGQETTVHSTRIVGADGNASMEMQFVLSDVDSVTVNAVLFDGVWYLDLGNMRKSLEECKNPALLAFADKAPNNIAYITFNEADILFKDYFAEEEETQAGIKGVFNLLDRSDLVLNMFLGAVNQKGGFKFDVVDERYTLASTEECGSILLQMLTNINSYYDKYCSNLSSLNLASEYEASKGFKANKDNFLSSLNDVQLRYSVMDSGMFTPSIKGDISVFESKQSGIEYDGSLGITWNSDKSKDNAIEFKFSYKSAVSAVDKPSSTEIDIAKFNESYFEFESLFDTILREGNILGAWYLDTSLASGSVDIGSQMESLAREYLGIGQDVNVADYVSENSSSSSVSELIDIFDSIVGGFKIEVDKPTDVVEVSQYNKLTGIFPSGVEYSFNINEEVSGNSILVVDIRLLNTSDSTVSFETRGFKLRDMGTSILSANIKTQLLEVNPEFDTDLCVEEISVDRGCFIDTKLYFVVPDNLGYQDLYYEDELIGNLISF